MKKLLASILITIMATSCIACSAGNQNNNSQSESNEEKTYSIRYYAVEYYRINSKEPVLTEINPRMFRKDGSYPTGYDEGEAVYISPLQSGLVEINANEDREFKGWYADVTCTTLYSDVTTTVKNFPDWLGVGEEFTVSTDEFSGLTIQASGDLILYAKLNCGYWVGFY